MNPSIKYVVSFLFTFFFISIFSQETELTILDICPRTIVVESDDYDCTSGRTSERLAGKELVLLNTSKIKVETIDFNGTKVYQCKCDYGIFPEQREVIDCDSGEQLPASDNCVEGVCAPFYFFDLLYYRWIEENLVTEQKDCDRFKSKYGRDKPSFFKTDFNLATPAFIPSFFEGIGRTDRAVVMVCPWEGTDYFSYDYIKNKYESSMEVIYERAVSYETCMPVVNPGAFFFDLNPVTYDEDFFNDDFQTLEDVLSVDSPVELADVLIKPVNGTTADGVSDILISINGFEGGSISLEDLDEKYGKINMPWGNEAFNFSGSPFHVITYSPPDAFPESLSKFTTPDGHIFTNIRLKMEISSGNEQSVEAEFAIPLIRPPVVLVHGTFDNPENCWKTPIKSQKSMYQSLLDEGYVVRTVDYQNSNGDESTPCSNFVDELFQGETSISSFECNKKVVYENPGGIKDAIDYYRDTLYVAATQADVIGHSMGGVLPRVLASDDDLIGNRYNEDYYRNDNFNDGDINRLISIASTHHGSDGSEFLSDFNESWKDSGIPMMERLADGFLTGLLWYAGGIGGSGAVKDQIPMSPALRRIGATKVPSHAIVCTIRSFEDIDNNEANPDTYFTYGNLLRGLTSYFYFFPGSLNKYFKNTVLKYKRLTDTHQNKNFFQDDVIIRALPRNTVLQAGKPKNLQALTDQVENGLAEFWQNWHIFQEMADEDWIDDEDISYQLQYETAEYNHYEEDDDFNNYIEDRRYDLISGEIPDESKIIASENFALDFIRYLMFKNDLNDCVVRYESQTGSMEPPYISHFENHIHSFAPRYQDVINRIKSLLAGGMSDFNTDGFPAAGKKMSISIPDPDYIMSGMNQRNETTSPTRYGDEAICWSGMVPSHAEAFLNIAVDKDVVILTRPVNPDATPLIADNAATKGMNLKGKSSSWGPHKGYIPVFQKYSKLWFLYGDDTTERDKQIRKFSAKTVKQLKEEPEMVVNAPLSVTYNCAGSSESYKIYVDTFIMDALSSIFLVQKSDDVYNIYPWTQDNDGQCPNVEPMQQQDIGRLIPLEVMSKPRSSDTIYYTADYDLLAIGFKDVKLKGWEKDPYIVETLENFDKEKGFITDDQKELLAMVNNEVRIVSGYTGGDVSHHGPENQFYILSNPSEGSPYVDYPITAFYKEDGRGIVRSIPRGPDDFRDRYLKRFMADRRRAGYNLYENIHSPGWAWSFHSTYTYAKGWDDRDSPYLKDSPEEIPFSEDCRGGNIIPDHSYFYVQEAERPFEQTDLFEIYPNPASEWINIYFKLQEFEKVSYQLTNSIGSIIKTGIISLDGPLASHQIDISDISSGMYLFTVQLGSRILSKGISIVK